MTASDFFDAGVVTGTHGLRGDLKVKPAVAESTSLLSAVSVTLKRGESEVGVYEVCKATLHKGNILLRFKGAERIEAVQDLKGCAVFMRVDELSEPEDDEHYFYELEGMTVVDRQKGDLGKLTEIFTTAAHDIYVVEGSFGEVLIPVVKEIVLEVDEESGRIMVDLPSGLVQEPDEV